VHPTRVSGVRRATRLLLITAACGGLLATTLAVASASPPSITSLRARVDRLEAVLANQEQRSQALAQNFDALVGRQQLIDTSLHRMYNRVRVNRIKLAATARVLRGDAVLAYVSGSSVANSVSIFTQNANENEASGVYEQTAIGDLAAIEAEYQNQAAVLHADERNLGARRAAVDRVLRQEESLRVENQLLAVRTNRLVRSMGHELHHLVLEAAIAAARAAARERAQQAAAASAAAVAGQLGGVNGTILALQGFSGAIAGSATGNASGMAAFAAAKSQIGVPYVWGGEQPGVGFDCSGLTQWAWAQAGVSIPRTAAEQWGALRHVGLGALQPGDLLFYFNLDGDGQVDHVVMYGGSGPWGSQTTIAADTTGTDIALQPAFTYGLIGAARP
jgi:cell wall-associated NlpC family hydrolase